MKLISCVIRQESLEAVREALAQLGVVGLTVWSVSGVGQQGGHTEIYRGQNYRVDLLPKLRLDVAVHEEKTQEVVQTIADTACSGRPGDGKIWVTNLEQVVRIRTGERGQDAL